jgi:dTDP-4-amino-4,6-dideoxygalactose transaminase
MTGLIPRAYWAHSFSDFFHGLAAALVPRGQGKVLHIADLASCIPVRSGRAGLVAAIRALDLPRRGRIGVPLFCCPVVFKAITAAGCIPCFIDIEPDTFCISPEDLIEKRANFEAVIAVHMFGNLCDMAKLKVVAEDRPIIEDCAQAISSKIKGRMAGSFGDIAFFSFRSGKYLSVGEGGALYSGDANIYSRISQFIAEMATPTRAEECAHVLEIYIKSILRNRPLYGIVGHRLWHFFNKKMKLSENSHVVLSQIYMADFNLIKKRLPLLDSLIERQRANALFFSRTLQLEPDMLCSERPGTYYNRYHYPIIFPSTEHRDLIAAYLLNSQIDSMKYLDDVVDVATNHYGYKGDCPVAERLSKRVLIIPSYYSLRKMEVQRIAHCVNAAWAKITKRARRD